MKVRPLRDRIIVKRVDADEPARGGIVIPDTAKEKPTEGRVIAVGAGAIDETGKVIPLDVRKGDRILFSRYAGVEIDIGGVEHLIIREGDILGIIEAGPGTHGPGKPPPRPKPPRPQSRRRE